MSKQNKKDHPYNYSIDKNLVQHLLDWGVPIGLFYLYFQFYNFGKITPSEMVKTSGLLAIALLSLTLIAGPIARFFPSLDILKAHRKFWGITSFFVALIHSGLVSIFYLKFDFLKLIDPSNPKYLGLAMGIMSLFVLLVVTLSSHRRALTNLDPKLWKTIQLTSYLALALALIHFTLIEQVNGVLTIKRLLGQLTFGFAFLAVLFRLIVLFFPGKSGK